MKREKTLRARIKILTWVFIAGLVASGATAIPLEAEVGWLAQIFGVSSTTWIPWDEGVRGWIWEIRNGLQETNANYPFIAYGTDWLAFGHFIIAVFFLGAVRDPVRNVWLFTFGMITCMLLVPYALVFGAIRGIPIWWRMVDISFGVFGFIPLYLCRKWVLEIEQTKFLATQESPNDTRLRGFL
jgi:hypothetical protein